MHRPYISWVKPDDGMLARDLNGNGLIDNQGELFGTAAASGFAQLSALDSNTDGVINASDTAFASLRIWRDLDQDGVTDAGELKTLAQAGIASISLATSAPASTVMAGNTVTDKATVTFTGGATTTISNVILEGNQLDSKFLGNTTVSAAAAAAPQLKGYGNVKDLGLAMTGDATLLAQVQAFKALPATAAKREAVLMAA
jgi:hypothetical protein